MAGPAEAPARTDYDAIIVGGSLAGCAAAMFLGRAGARVALVEKQPDPKAYKRMCSHYIQPSAVATLERLGLLPEIEAAGGLRSRFNMWTQWGWIRVDERKARVPAAVNLRRELLDPLVREAAGATDGVELILGQTVHELRREGDRVVGVTMRDRAGAETELRAPLTIGADGRDSRVAELSGTPTKQVPHNRFAYGGYFEGAAIDTAPDAQVWFLDPQWAAAFPTDGDLMFYAAMPTKDRLPEFKRDPEAALVRFLSDLPQPPPIAEGRLVGPVIGKVDMTNKLRRPTMPGLALIGDAALATDPLWGVGCGWAFQSAEWLSDAVAPVLTRGGALDDALESYRKRWARHMHPHAFFIHDYANGRTLNPLERALFAAATRDEDFAARFEEFGTRSIAPQQFMPSALPRALAINARHALRRRRAGRAPLGEPQAEAAAA